SAAFLLRQSQLTKHHRGVLGEIDDGEARPADCIGPGLSLVDDDLGGAKAHRELGGLHLASLEIQDREVLIAIKRPLQVVLEARPGDGEAPTRTDRPGAGACLNAEARLLDVRGVRSPKTYAGIMP